MLAFQQDEQLFNDAFERRIVVVTPTTLLATLRTVASLWFRTPQPHRKTGGAGRWVYDKLVSVVERFEKVGSQLNTVQKTYDDAWKAMKSGHGNLISQSQKFLQLGVRVKKNWPAIWPKRRWNKMASCCRPTTITEQQNERIEQPASPRWLPLRPWARMRALYRKAPVLP